LIEPTPIESLGDRNYRVGDETTVLEDAEDSVLQPFFRDVKKKPKWVGLDKEQLVQESGHDNAPRILKRLENKPPLFGSIRCPGKRGQGGYRVYVTKSRKISAKSYETPIYPFQHLSALTACPMPVTVRAWIPLNYRPIP